MKIYLAGERDIFALSHGQDWPKETNYETMMAQYVRRRLFSFYYHGFSGGKSSTGPDGLTEDIRKSYEANMDLFLDSGAFTAFTKKTEISVKEYIDYTKQHGHLFNAISSLDDTNKDEQKSYDNFAKLKDAGCNVCPVFHTREDPKWLVRYIEEGHPYLFIGGMVPETTRWLLGWLDWIWSEFLILPDGKPRLKVHGFGLTDQQLMFRYPWYSVDSTSWLMTGIFGACVFPPAQGARNQGRLEKVEMSKDSPTRRKAQGRHYDNLTLAEREQVDLWLADLGVTAEQCSKHFSYRDVVNAATFQAMESRGAKHFVREQETLFNG